MVRTDRSVAPRRARPMLGQPTYVSPHYQSRFWGRVVFALFVLVLAGGIGGVGGLYWLFHQPQGSSARVVSVHVGPGDTVTSVAERLHRRGIVNNALVFRIDARLHNLSSKLKVGDYFVRRNMTLDQLITALTVYHSDLIRITIPEGRRKEEIAAILARHGISSRQFLQAVRHPNFTYSILRDKPPGASLEGYLFPNTYEVPKVFSGRAFAALMLQTLNNVFTPAMRAEAARHGRTVFQTLVLASIVEREARMASERPTIASVYANRLNIHMVLDADPTIQYALGTPRNWWPLLTQDDYKLNLRYSTYTHNGLPPGPIANPGLSSIKAAVSPARTPFFYFVARGHGFHAFARTYAEQLANQRRYLNQP